MRLNLGCGHNAAPGWVNVDYSLGSRLRWIPFSGKFFRQKWDRSILVVDLRRALPWPDNSVDAIYCSHFLEHLTKSSGIHCGQHNLFTA
jgi:predicted SAM-dependent methyltransferase